ncbi:MAG: hypothetical protein SFV51_16130 [Bryobacteraceae bacterium]|nr:hypothetical protein [Bryobacteraceae bacterium]
MFRPLLCLGVLSCLGGGAQAQSPATQTGVAPIWDVRSMLKGLVDQTQRYRGVVEQLQAGEWVSKGASETYVRHKEIVQKQVGYLSSVSNQLYQNPEKLPLALDILFRLQALETFTASLSEGAMRYQSAELAADIQKLIDQNAGLRTQLRNYVMDLSVTKETEYAVAEKEAQRCQAVINRNPLAPQPKRGPGGKN